MPPFARSAASGAETWPERPHESNGRQTGPYWCAISRRSIRIPIGSSTLARASWSRRHRALADLQQPHARDPPAPNLAQVSRTELAAELSDAGVDTVNDTVCQ